MSQLSATSSASPFQSFFLGGFECATHLRRDGVRIDVINETGHDVRAAEDYLLLRKAGVLSARDGLRWHLIEAVPGHYDWSSFMPMLEAAYATGTQVLWDLCHWGLPDGLSPFSPEFPARFSAFATAAATLVRDYRRRAGSSLPTIYCAINEVSFWSWVGGDQEHFHPYAKDRGADLKRQLARASIEAIRSVRMVDPEARFVQAEPIIHISANETTPEASDGAAKHTAGQFEAWDMLAGRREPELGGQEDLLDVLGVNYYWNNQWVHMGDRTPPGHLQHRPFHAMLVDIWHRYQRPILITETGAEAEAAVGWLGYICAEVRQARRLGVPVLGICLYPITDYPGWDDGRHCCCGLIELDEHWQERSLRADLSAEIALQQKIILLADAETIAK